MKRRRTIVSLFATAVLLISCFFSVGCMGLLKKRETQVPVYERMTVHYASETVQGTSFTLYSAQNNSEGDKHATQNNSEGNKHSYDGNYKDKWEEKDKDKPFDDGKDVEDAVGDLQVEGGASALYYAKPNQDVYITVHISNPAGYEILSFVLNGNKYTSYMFEYGSDLENLILKVNVGDVAGFVDYTIDAIKYVDGTKIKDVIMSGEKTVQVGVYRNDLVSVNVTDEQIGYTDISFDMQLLNEYGLIEKSNGQMKIFVYDGEEVLAEREVSLTQGETEWQDVAFFGLRPDSIYQYAVVAYYDALEGDGFAPHVLYKQAFVTQAVVQFSDIEIAEESISFAWSWNDAWENKTFTSVELWQGGELLRTLLQADTQIDGLLQNTEYTLVGKYLLENKEESVYLTFKTKADKPVLVESQGLKIENGVITGIGTCTDTTLYLNHPVAERAFESCQTITQVVFLEGVTWLGECAFKDCEYTLKTVVFTTAQPPQIESDLFCWTWDSTDFRIYVPVESLSLYKAITAEYWQSYAVDNIYGVEMEDFIVGDPEDKDDNPDLGGADDKEDGGDGETTDKLQESKGLKIENGVITGIGTCTDTTLYLNHPVAARAFESCQTITQVVFLEGANYLAENAFGLCNQLKTAVFTTVQPPQIGSDLFCGTWDPEEFRIYVPVESVYLYKAVAAEFWQSCAVDNIYGMEMEGTTPDKWDNYTGQGLYLVNGVITGIGVCTDTTLYINYPVAERAFAGCQTITKVVFLEGATTLGDNAFEGCNQLKTVMFTTAQPPQIGGDLFCVTWDSEGFRIYVPVESLSLYKAVDAWGWENALDNISSVNVMEDVDPIKSHEESVGLEISGDVITGIGTCLDTILYLNHPVAPGAFSGNQTIIKVILLEGVDYIGQSAFEGCSNLKTVMFISENRAPKVLWYAFGAIWGQMDSVEILIPAKALDRYMTVEDWLNPNDSWYWKQQVMAKGKISLWTNRENWWIAE